MIGDVDAVLEDGFDGPVVRRVEAKVHRSVQSGNDECPVVFQAAVGLSEPTRPSDG